MGEFCGLKFHLSYLHPLQRFIFEIPPCAKKVNFVAEFVDLCKNPPIYELKKDFLKKALHMVGFQKHFSYTTSHHHF